MPDRYNWATQQQLCMNNQFGSKHIRNAEKQHSVVKNMWSEDPISVGQKTRNAEAHYWLAYATVGEM